jgi:hypothetical protein
MPAAYTLAGFGAPNVLPAQWADRRTKNRRRERRRFCSELFFMNLAVSAQ